jgi:nucleoside-diphosphate-sugar epimerase
VGHRSLLGRHLIALLSPDYEIITAGRQSSADVVFDLEDRVLPSAPPFDVAVICAASFLDNGPQGMITNEEVNAVGPLRVAAIALASGCRHIVYISTTSALGAQTAYGLSKRHGQENLELLCSTHGITYTALLLTAIYDREGLAERHQPFLYAIMRAAQEGRDITLYGKQDPLRNYLFIDDATEVIRKVVQTQLEGIYPCLHPSSYRASEIAQLALETYGTPGRVIWDRDKPDIAPSPLVEDDRLFERLGLRPTVDLPAGMALIRDHSARG